MTDVSNTLATAIPHRPAPDWSDMCESQDFMSRVGATASGSKLMSECLRSSLSLSTRSLAMQRPPRSLISNSGKAVALLTIPPVSRKVAISSPAKSCSGSMESSPMSPTESVMSAASMEEYLTPVTSPESSPTRPCFPRFPRLLKVMAHLDGADDERCDEEELPDSEPVTPLCASSPGTDARSPRIDVPAPSIPKTPQRHASLLLKHCERNAAPRHRRLMAGGIHTPDRFIPSRSNTPTEDSVHLARPAERLQAIDSRSGLSSQSGDPFAPSPSRSIRMAEQYATLRAPPPPIHPVGRTGSSVSNGNSNAQLAISDGGIWTVGGTMVTGGVASATNGRGGRVTSGTSASHYTADFLRKRSASDVEKTHGRRLAVAMDIDQSARLLDHGSPGRPSSPASPTSRVWRDCV